MCSTYRLSVGVVQESFVAALDARGVPPTHLLRPGVAWALRIHVRAKDLRRPGRTDSVLAAIDTALGHGSLTTYGRRIRRVA